MNLDYKHIYERVVSESIPLIFIIIVGVAAVGLSDFALPDTDPDNQTDNLSEQCRTNPYYNYTQKTCEQPTGNLTQIGDQCFDQYNKSSQINQCIRNKTK